MRFPILTLLLLTIFTTTQAQLPLEPGVSRSLADYRAAHISNIQ
jgi:hypothetical protein